MYLVKAFKEGIAYVDNGNTIIVRMGHQKYEKKIEGNIINFYLLQIPCSIILILCDNRKLYIWRNMVHSHAGVDNLEEYDFSMINIKMVDHYILNGYTIIFNYQPGYENSIINYNRDLCNGKNTKLNQGMRHLVGVNLLDHFQEDELKNVVMNHSLGMISTKNKFIIFDGVNDIFRKYNMPPNEEYCWIHKRSDRLIVVYKNVITSYILKDSFTLNENILEKKYDILHKFTGKVKILSMQEYALIIDSKEGLLMNTVSGTILGILPFNVEDMNDVGEIVKFMFLHTTNGERITFTIEYVTKTDDYKSNAFTYYHDNNIIKLESSNKYKIENGIKCIFNNENKQKSAYSIIR